MVCGGDGVGARAGPERSRSRKERAAEEGVGVERLDVGVCAIRGEEGGGVVDNGEIALAGDVIGACASSGESGEIGELVVVSSSSEVVANLSVLAGVVGLQDRIIGNSVELCARFM